MERTDSRDDNSLTTAVADGFHAAVYSGLQQPYDAIRQIAGQVHIDLPNAHLVSAPEQATSGSAAWVAESVGSAAGMIPWVIASNKLVRAGGSLAGIGREGAALASGMGIAEAGMTGAVYSTLFQPTQTNGNFLFNKAADAGIAFSTFAAGAGINNMVRPMFGSFTSELANRAVNAGTASMAGFGAGIVSAEAGNLLGKPHQDVMQTGLKFAVAGGVFGATSKNGFTSETEIGASKNGFDSKVNAMSKNLGHSGDPIVSGTVASERSAPYFAERLSAPAKSGDLFGPRPEVIEQTLPEVKARYGENSPEHASTLVQLGDAHMTQGKLSSPGAEASYLEALRIFSSHGADTPQTAWVYDKLATVKQVSGDTVGAAANLSKALEIWQSSSRESALPAESYIARRTEDLARLQTLNRFNATKPGD
ncbi:MAG: tetratricopeptide repeat protein [Candidatus Obscuribacterales bacterium]|nr:MAG: tetratricopeptide repeat protein [Candidatus Melainabacteria bacterium]